MEIKSLDLRRSSKFKKTSNNHRDPQSRRLALLEQNLKNLERFEMGIKKHMQDRKNFSNSENAHRVHFMLVQLAKKLDLLRSEIERLRNAKRSTSYL